MAKDLLQSLLPPAGECGALTLLFLCALSMATMAAVVVSLMWVAGFL
jgi:hypothetical protein